MPDLISPTAGGTSAPSAPVRPAAPSPPVQAQAREEGGIPASGVRADTPASPAPGSPKVPAQAPNPAAVEAAAARVRDYLKNLPAEVQYSLDKESGRIVYKVVNPTTHEVIRELPPEEILAMARKLKELDKKSTGIFVDKQL